jgi:HK97 family phage prohead protease
MPAIPVHHTATTDEPWDGPAAVAAMPAEYADLHYCHAWQTASAAGSSHTPGDDDEDDKKGNFKFPHHKTKGGPANLAACRNGLARLTGASIPPADRSGVKAHLQAHLDDANKKGSHAMDDPAREERAATPPDVLAEHRTAMRGQRERRHQPLIVPSVPLFEGRGNARAQFEFRANPDSAAGPSFRFEGYAATFEQPFEMWDAWGDPYDEVLSAHACNRTLANGCDTQFLVGHDESGLPMARTRSGTMTLSADSSGLLTFVPRLDGRNPQVLQLASAMERGDVDEMSIGFIAAQQQWSKDWMTRRIDEISLHRGDVSIVCWAANPNANGASLEALPVSEAARRALGAVETRAVPGAGEPEEQAPEPEPDFSSKPPQNTASHGDNSPTCPNGDCGAPNAQDAGYCDQCGTCLYDDGGLISSGDLDDVITDASGLIEEEDMTLAAQARVRVLQLRG